MMLIKCIMRDGTRAFYDVRAIDAGRFSPNDSKHLIFRGTCYVDHRGRKRDDSDIVPLCDIVSITLYGATQNFDGTMTVTTSALRDRLSLLYSFTGLDCAIIIGTKQQGEEELKTIL